MTRNDLVRRSGCKLPGTWDTPKPIIRVKRPVTSDEYLFAVSWMAHHRKQPAQAGPGLAWRCRRSVDTDPERPDQLPVWFYHCLPTFWFPDIETATRALAIALAEVRESLTLPR